MVGYNQFQFFTYSPKLNLTTMGHLFELSLCFPFLLLPFKKINAKCGIICLVKHTPIFLFKHFHHIFLIISLLFKEYWITMIQKVDLWFWLCTLNFNPASWYFYKNILIVHPTTNCDKMIGTKGWTKQLERCGSASCSRL